MAPVNPLNWLYVELNLKMTSGSRPIQKQGSNTVTKAVASNVSAFVVFGFIDNAMRRWKTKRAVNNDNQSVGGSF